MKKTLAQDTLAVPVIPMPYIASKLGRRISPILRAGFLLFLIAATGACDVRAPERGGPIKIINEKTVSLTLPKDIVPNIDGTYYFYNYGVFATEGKLSWTDGKTGVFTVESGMRFIQSNVSTIRSTPAEPMEFIRDSLSAGFLRFWELHTGLVRINPAFALIGLLMLILVVNIVRTALVPRSQRRWREKIIADVVRLNRDAIDWVAKELEEIPARRINGHARALFIRQPIDLIKKHVQGIGDVLTQRMKDAGFETLESASVIGRYVQGIGGELQARIDSFAQQLMKEIASRIQSGKLQFEDPEVTNYFDDYREAVLNQQVRLHGDARDIVELSEQIERSQEDLRNLGWFAGMKAYFRRESGLLRHPRHSINILIAFACTFALFFFAPISAWIMPGVHLWSVILVCYCFAFAATVYCLAQYGLFSEAAPLLGIPLNPQNLKEQRLQLEALRMSLYIGIATPEVRIIPNNSYNAMAVGGRFVRSVVLLHSALVENLPYDQVRAILGHEISHLRTGDSRTFQLHGTIMGLVDFIQNLGFSLHQFISEIPIANIFSYLYAMANYYMMMATRTMALVLNFMISRQMEFRADAGGASFTSAEDMVGALRSLEHSPDDDSYFPLHRSAYIRPISENLSGMRGFTEAIFETHPSTEARIAAIEKQFGHLEHGSERTDTPRVKSLRGLLKN